jgi:hypothetical protein
VLGWRDSAGNGEHDRPGQERAQENLDETLIEDRQRGWLGSRHLTATILRNGCQLIHPADVATVVVRDTADGWEHREGEETPVPA